jgi:quercetin dioxygenase-like cupin family protein
MWRPTLKVAAAALVAASVTTHAAPARAQARQAIDVRAEEIQAALARTAGMQVSDQAIRMVDLGDYDVGVGLVHRSPGAQGAIAHSDITEIYHVTEGAGTLVTGGSLVNPKPVPSDNQIVRVLNGPSTTGDSIRGGTARRIKAGDVVIIPPNTPHWFSEVETPQIVYVVVRVDPKKVVQLK